MVKSYLAKEIEGQYAYVITGTHDIGSVLNTDNEGLFSRHIFINYFKGIPMSRNRALIRLETSVITNSGLEVMILGTQITFASFNHSLETISNRFKILINLKCKFRKTRAYRPEILLESVLLWRRRNCLLMGVLARKRRHAEARQWWIFHEPNVWFIFLSRKIKFFVLVILPISISTGSHYSTKPVKTLVMVPGRQWLTIGLARVRNLAVKEKRFY